MKFIETKLQDAYIIEIEPIGDNRGLFARTWCKKTFDIMGLNTTLAQFNISFNKKKGTLRGMHYQLAPHKEAKLLRCTQGAIYDVICDIRPDSVTFKQWVAIELNSKNRKMLYIPEGFAHGFQTLDDNTELFYQMSEFYHPESARGFCWNDPIFNIQWPLTPIAMSKQDKDHPDFQI